MQSFTRGRSARNRRDKLRAEGRAQSLPRDPPLAPREIATQSKEVEPPVSKHGGVTADAPRRRGRQGGAPQGAVPPHSYKAYQLYTLYRSRDGRIMQAPLNGCRCEPLIRKLENQLQATKEEMKAEIHSVQDLMNSNMGRLDQKNKNQIWALEKMTLERLSAERSECVQRVEQKVRQEREEAERRQETLLTEIKSWCLSRLQSMEVHLAGDPSSSKAETCSQSAKAGLGLLDVGSRCGLEMGGSEAEGGSANHHGCSGGDETRADVKSPLVATQVVRPKELDLRSLRPSKPSRPSRPSSLSPSKGRRCHSRTKDGLKGRTQDPQKKKQQMKHLQDSRGAAGVQSLEVFVDQASPELAFAQEEDHLDETQQLGEVASTQMKQSYQREVQDARWRANQKAHADIAALMERVSHLEDELQTLKNRKHQG